MIRLDRPAALRVKGAKVCGDSIRVPCPVHGSKTDSLSLGTGKKGHAIWHCFAGCDPTSVRDKLVEMKVLHMDTAAFDDEQKREQKRLQDQKRTQEWIRRTFAGGKSKPSGAMVGYLTGRSIPQETILAALEGGGPILRWSSGGVYERMLAAVMHDTNGFTGLHMTTLWADGTKTRKCNGAIKGGAIRLGGKPSARALCIAEGIETALAWSALNPFFMGPTWSVISASGIQNFVPPAGIKRLYVAADFDGASITGYERLAARSDIQERGIEVKLKLPPRYGIDFNDVLIERCAR